MSFSGKVVLITGASSGIGADAAHHLASKGASVSIVGRNEKRLNEVAKEISKAGHPTPLAIVADVTKDAERIINETIKHFGKLDVLVNNAGIFGSDTVTGFDVNGFDRNVVNVSSVAGLKAFGSFMTYCISKSGLDQFTKCAALDLASKNIRVNSVNPATIRTPLFAAIGIDKSNEAQFYEDQAKIYLVKRVGEVSDTSSAIAYLASESFINGTCLPVDGGCLLGTNENF
ncbi:uncharacterized protein LOC116350697 isoform X2 [Contarinia nasturtii]|uniref:uncharacterized protein LOC116350697 isoform X2 n=1 Tax=Contarinia nasturtii TaxID=265458 RepID=UPI0012D3C334|nr:uncharacterized protein LOC116350697 isoform X2 [Contarinia nasturtii]